jgi:hypothetical protein
LKVGWQGTWYEFRTVLLPFIFIFNPELLMIDIGGPLHFLMIVSLSALAMMAFCAAFQGFFFARNRIWETALLLVCCFTLFRPNFWMDMVVPPTRDLPASALEQTVAATPAGDALRFKVITTDLRGDDVERAVRVALSEGRDTPVRLAGAGIGLSGTTITSIRPGSVAARLKLQPGDRISAVTVPNDRPTPFLFAIPAVVAVFGLAWLQRRRRRVPVARAVPA